jgi:hypothetical protein
MAEKKETYVLKDQETSFFDDESGLTITRDEQVEIGDGKGRKTVQMIKSGGLLKVDSSAAAAGAKENNSQTPKSGAIPEDFPHAKLLAENGITTFAPLHKLNTQQLVDLKGIGEKKAEEIEKALGR